MTLDMPRAHRETVRWGVTMGKKEGLSPDGRKALEELRGISRGLPEALETTTFGHPTFQVNTRTFVVLDDHERPGMLCLVFKATPDTQAGLIDGVRFFASKFGSKHGWTAMRADERTNWRQASELITASYRLVAPKRSVSALDAQTTPSPTRRRTRPSRRAVKVASECRRARFQEGQRLQQLEKVPKSL